MPSWMPAYVIGHRNMTWGCIPLKFESASPVYIVSPPKRDIY